MFESALTVAFMHKGTETINNKVSSTNFADQRNETVRDDVANRFDASKGHSAKYHRIAEEVKSFFLMLTAPEKQEQLTKGKFTTFSLQLRSDFNKKQNEEKKLNFLERQNSTFSPHPRLPTT